MMPLMPRNTIIGFREIVNARQTVAIPWPTEPTIKMFRLLMVRLSAIIPQSGPAIFWQIACTPPRYTRSVNLIPASMRANIVAPNSNISAPSSAATAQRRNLRSGLGSYSSTFTSTYASKSPLGGFGERATFSTFSSPTSSFVSFGDTQVTETAVSCSMDPVTAVIVSEICTKELVRTSHEANT